jgi:hypothetical protein
MRRPDPTDGALGGPGRLGQVLAARAYSAELTTNAERTAALQRFLDGYNYHRPHTALRRSPRSAAPPPVSPTSRHRAASAASHHYARVKPAGAMTTQG